MQVLVPARPEVLVPEAVDDPQDGEPGGDEDEALVLRGGPLRGHEALVLAAPEDRLVDGVERDAVGVGSAADLVVLAAKVLHAAHLPLLQDEESGETFISQSL